MSNTRSLLPANLNEKQPLLMLLVLQGLTADMWKRPLQGGEEGKLLNLKSSRHRSSLSSFRVYRPAEEAEKDLTDQMITSNRRLHFKGILRLTAVLNTWKTHLNIWKVVGRMKRATLAVCLHFTEWTTVFSLRRLHDVRHQFQMFWLVTLKAKSPAVQFKKQCFLFRLFHLNFYSSISQ